MFLFEDVPGHLKPVLEGIPRAVQKSAFGDTLLPAARSAVEEMPGGEIRLFPATLNALESLWPPDHRNIANAALFGLEHCIELSPISGIEWRGHRPALPILIHLSQLHTQSYL